MGLLENKFQDNVVVASLDKILGWARSTSPWYFQFGLACCAIEMMASAASRHDLERIGMMPRSSPRQADVMIVAGTVTMKMALRVKKLYEQKIDSIFLLSPTTEDERIKLIAEQASGFLYYVSLKGVTGAANIDIKQVSEKVNNIKNRKLNMK